MSPPQDISTDLHSPPSPSSPNQRSRGSTAEVTFPPTPAITADIHEPRTNNNNEAVTPGSGGHNQLQIQQQQQSSAQHDAYSFGQGGNPSNSTAGDIALPSATLLPPLSSLGSGSSSNNGNSSYPAYPSYSLPAAFPQQPQGQGQQGHYRNGPPTGPYPSAPGNANFRYTPLQLATQQQATTTSGSNYAGRGYAPPPQPSSQTSKQHHQLQQQAHQGRFVFSRPVDNNAVPDLPVLPVLDNIPWEQQNQFEQLRGGSVLESIHVAEAAMSSSSQKRPREWNEDGNDMLEGGSASGSKEGDDEDWADVQNGGEQLEGEVRKLKAKKTKTTSKQSLEDIANGTPTGKSPTKKFVCPHASCGRAFARNFNLQSHIKSHLGVRDFNCPECPKSFSRRHDCARHCIAVHHYSKETGKPRVDAPPDGQGQGQDGGLGQDLPSLDLHSVV